MKNVPRIVIAGTQSGVGKTSVTLAIMTGLQKAGYRVQGYKVGPDYIDPGYHAVATGRPSHNLDDWMIGKEASQWLFQQTSQDCDVAVIEGVMGLFDGLSSKEDTASTAAMAKLLNSPVILVIDAGSMARSVAAIIKGYQTLDPQLRICGVILNRVASQNHLSILREAIDFYNQIPVLGAVLRNEKMRIPERHLGLKTTSENSELLQTIDALGQLTDINQEGVFGINLKKILEVAQEYLGSDIRINFDIEKKITYKTPVRIAYAKDKAFQFYYQANLDYLKNLGAQLIPFSPIEDRQLPDNVHGLYFGGGFPEIYAQQLEENSSMRQAVREAIENGMPTYAECGGLMYLTQGIKTLEGKIYKMVSVIPGLVEMTPKLVNFGYGENELIKDCFLGKQGEQFRGHEFHYSHWDAEGTESIHRVDKKRRQSSRTEGYQKGSLLASYVHCHFLSYPKRALCLIETARRFAKTTTASEAHSLHE